jgi:hypothetical protein
MKVLTASTKVDADGFLFASTMKVDAVDMLLVSTIMDASAIGKNKRIKND